MLTICTSASARSKSADMLRYHDQIDTAHASLSIVPAPVQLMTDSLLSILVIATPITRRSIVRHAYSALAQQGQTFKPIYSVRLLGPSANVGTSITFVSQAFALA